MRVVWLAWVRLDRRAAGWAVWSGLQVRRPLLIVLIALLAASLRGAVGTTWRASIARSLALYLAFGFAAAVVAFAYAGITLLLWR